MHFDWKKTQIYLSRAGWPREGRYLIRMRRGRLQNWRFVEKHRAEIKKLRTGNFHRFRRSLKKNEQVRETFDLKNISPGAKFPDGSCPALRYILVYWYIYIGIYWFYKDYVYRVCPSFVLDLKQYLRY